MYRAINPARRRGGQILTFLVTLFASVAAGANPQGATVVHGSASFVQPNPGVLEITNSPSAILNWQSFDIGVAETTRFIQDSAASAVLNRVVGGNSSEILGQLISNGRVFLLNPAGILIGRDAIVDTAGLVMSTLDMSDEDFLQGRLHFAGDASAGGITNHGYIKTAPGGEIVLIAPTIVNESLPGNPDSGLIESPEGELVLAAGYSITIASLDHPDITFDVRAPDNEAINLGRLLARGGSVNILAASLRHSGEINADSLIRDESGSVVLTVSDTAYLDRGSLVSAAGEGRAGTVAIDAGGGNGRIYALGAIDASGDHGGAVDMHADRILVSGSVSAAGVIEGGQVVLDADTEVIATASARLDASSASGGGGTVAVDGGAGVFSSALVTATGVVGGEVEILGDDVTLAAATIDASGVAAGGRVRIGGGFQGGEGLRAATTTEVNAATVIKADAITAGQGGSVVVWADDTTRFDGIVSATGGSAGGNGGTVEVSGKQGLAFSGQVDVSAPAGAAGSLLLDPKNIFFSSGAQGAGTIQILDPHPGVNNNFGQDTQILGDNMVVFDHLDDFGGANAGAVYLYRLSDGALLSALTGSNPNDEVGNTVFLQSVGGVRILRSTLWNTNAGAVTVFDPVNGLNGTVSAANSLVGAAANDQIGSFGVQSLGAALAVRSPSFDGLRGAVTIAASTALKGVVGATNSVVGANANDQVGINGLQFIGSGNYVVRSAHGGAGAVTFINPANPATGVVSAANSLVGTLASDDVGGGASGFGNGQVVSLGSRYAVLSPGWMGDFGAMTIGDTATGLVGTVGAGNSLVGGAINDRVGDNAPQSLFTGRYALVSDMNGAGAVTVFDPLSAPIGIVGAGNSLVGNAGDAVGSGGLMFLGSSVWAVLHPLWDASMIETDAGAVSVLDASTGNFAGTATPFTGIVGAANSLVGATMDDGIGSDGIQSIAGSTYGILSPGFDNVGAGATDSGAITWYVPGNTLSGAVGAGNSLLGAFDNDDVGGGSNNYDFLFSGHTLLTLPNFNSNAGAVVFLNSAGPVVGEVNATTALVGSQANDDVGSGGIHTFGTFYAVVSPDWDLLTTGNVGAITVANINTGITGAVGAGNSLIGASVNDRVGGGAGGGIIDLGNGNALAYSPAFAGSGAVTFLDFNSGQLLGDTDFIATVNNTNSLVAGGPGDAVGSGGVTLVGSKYIVVSPLFDNGPSDVGAVTVVDINSGLAGTLGAGNSLIGTLNSDRIGNGGLFQLGNGNALVLSPNWGNNKGAVTFLDLVNGNLIGDVDFIAALDNTNSLVGGTSGDNVGDNTGGDAVREFFTPGGNYYAIFAPDFANGAATQAGAVSFADMASGRAGTIDNTNSFVGTNTNDMIGLNAANFELTSGNVVLLNAQWNNNRGAATFVDLVNGVGLNGDIDATTSFIGGTDGDAVGSGGVTSLFGTSLFALRSPDWANGAQAQAGAISFGNVDTGLSGTLGVGNSLVGSTTGDNPGSNGVSVVFGGITQIAVFSPLWDNGAAMEAGAFTAFDATMPVSGAIGAGNSLVGTNTNDGVGGGSLGFPGNGNRVILTPTWNNFRGAATFWNTAGPIVGPVSATNSLVGSTMNDQVGSFGVNDIGGGRYYVASPEWNGMFGAVSFGSNMTGLSGAVGAANSLIGSSAGDRIGSVINNLSFSDRYLVVAETWNASRGAVTVFGPTGALPLGAVSAANSLVGASAGDLIGDVVQTLFTTDNRGLFVLRSNAFNSNSGAVTVFDPANPLIGTVGASNSLVGRPGDRVGSSGVSELSNGTLVVRSPLWSDGLGMNYGAATFMLAASRVNPVVGFVSASNSLVGSHMNDQVGSGSFSTLSSGNILLRSPLWFDNRGAITFVDRATGRTGVLSGANSLVGELANDFLGSGGITNLGGDRALVRSPQASVGGIAQAGRIDIIDGTTVQSVSGDIGFDSNPGGELTISIASVVQFLNSGAILFLQANNDIYLPLGTGLVADNGTLHLEAGRSIDIRGDLIVSGGTINLLGNAPGADSNFRDEGDGNITLAAGESGVRIVATNLSLEAQNIFVQAGNSANAYAGVIGLGATKIHAHGSGLLSLIAGTAESGSLVPNSSSEILSDFVNSPETIPVPAAFIVGGFLGGRDGLTVIADDVVLRGGGSEGAFAAIASFGAFSLEAINIELTPGEADNTDALLLGLGGVAEISFTNCEGCNEILFDPLFDAMPESGIYISDILREPTIDAILAMQGRDDEEDDEEEGEEEVGECN